MSDGRCQVVKFYYKGDVFGMEPDAEHVFSAKALSDSVIWVVNRSAARQADGGRLEHLVGGADPPGTAPRSGPWAIAGAQGCLREGASLLMNIAERSRRDGIDLPMGRQDMADYLGLTIETGSRMLTKLQTSAVVEFAGLRSFHIRNRPALSLLTQ
jgi:CRP/FNR family nitrogen fixation transcriptional regulator